MAVAPSFDDLIAAGKAEAIALRPDLQFRDGDIDLALLHGAAAMADNAIQFGAMGVKETFLDGADGSALTTLVDDRYNIQRKTPASSQSTVEFSRPAPGSSGTILAGTRVATGFDDAGQSIEFTTDANFFVDGTVGPFAIGITSIETGRDTNVFGVGTIIRVLDQPIFDPTWNVTNVVPAGGGSDVELDPALRSRVRDFFITLRRGTLAALEFGARLVETVAVALASEDSTGLVFVRVADTDGNSSAQMLSDVAIQLEEFRCAGSTLTVIGGTQILVDVSVTLKAEGGFSALAAAANLQAAYTTLSSKLNVGEEYYLDSISAALIAVAPDNIKNVRFDGFVVDGTPATEAALEAASILLGLEGTAIIPASGETIRAGTLTVA